MEPEYRTTEVEDLPLRGIILYSPYEEILIKVEYVEWIDKEPTWEVLPLIPIKYLPAPGGKFKVTGGILPTLY